MDVWRTVELSARLRTAGLRATGPRLAVLDALVRLGGHRRADEVHNHLTGQGYDLVRASVYNVLRDLTTAGLALLADVGSGVTLYEAGGTFHHHFVCRSCGSIQDIACVLGTPPCLHPDAGAHAGIATLDEAQIIFRGLCAGCGTPRGNAPLP
ncbi:MULTISPECIES: Fur family transcriptional regulator [Protofrankia]|uniref:Ferric uptake regulator, Fur family n=2 Tax=Protofrankia TaxID=2994361 RepID=F8AW56_9ACTN|nr:MULTISPECIES: Fur family transcriptional regulator [Protofrankia]AEH11382.1 ferric uptake regulator, Fur family [Candidatus Protofrankia datiscae]KLL10441.1 Fur family transcriptional regulator [Protofrankia coriariae]ONH33062.1 transcriptional repressor [Protofrankia sp. BMG5.30]